MLLRFHVLSNGLLILLRTITADGYRIGLVQVYKALAKFVFKAATPINWPLEGNRADPWKTPMESPLRVEIYT